MNQAQEIKAKMEELARWLQAKKKAEEMEKKLKAELDTMLQGSGMDSVKSPSLSAYYMKGRVSYQIVPARVSEAVANGIAHEMTTYELIKDEARLETAVTEGILDKKEGSPSLVLRLSKSK